MGRVGDTAEALRRSERGYTLIELLVAAMIGMVVLGGAVTVFVGAVRSEPRTASKVAAIQQGRTGVERITRELRQGLDVLDAPTPTSSQLSLITYVKQSSCAGPPAGSSIACLVTYNCMADECTRTVEEPDESASGPAVRVVSGLSSTDVFSYSPSSSDPTYVGVELSLTTQEGGPVVIADGAVLRNGES